MQVTGLIYRALIDLVYSKYKRLDFLFLNAGRNAHYEFTKLEDLTVF